MAAHPPTWALGPGQGAKVLSMQLAPHDHSTEQRMGDATVMFCYVHRGTSGGTGAILRNWALNCDMEIKCETIPSQKIA